MVRQGSETPDEGSTCSEKENSKHPTGGALEREQCVVATGGDHPRPSHGREGPIPVVRSLSAVEVISPPRIPRGRVRIASIDEARPLRVRRMSLPKESGVLRALW
mgnify:CR=1 FL=1